LEFNLVLAELFEAWLRTWNKKLVSQKRKVLLYLDGFKGHCNIELSQIAIKFLPPNTKHESAKT
jgi:hypothetical protein